MHLILFATLRINFSSLFTEVYVVYDLYGWGCLYSDYTKITLEDLQYKVLFYLQRKRYSITGQPSNETQYNSWGIKGMWASFLFIFYKLTFKTFAINAVFSNRNDCFLYFSDSQVINKDPKSVTGKLSRQFISEVKWVI